jgi:hypothetical protein
LSNALFAVGTVGVILSQALETSTENPRQNKTIGLMKALLTEAHAAIFAQKPNREKAFPPEWIPCILLAATKQLAEKTEAVIFL